MTIAIFIALGLIAIGTIFWFSRKKEALNGLINFFGKTEMPIWMSLSLALLAALGTYHFAPKINQQFEHQKSKSAHVLSTVSTVNEAISQLAISTREYNEALFYQRKDMSQKRASCLNSISRLQWILIDVNTIISRSGLDENSTNELSKSLASLQRALIESKHPEDQEKIIETFDLVEFSSKKMLEQLYEAANLTKD